MKPRPPVILALGPVLLLAGGTVPPASGAAAPEIVVTATRYPAATLELAGNTARLGADRIGLLNAAHIHELGTQIPGVWITRGSGQESLTAIRSPVLTGPGSCGSFLILEDGMASRPAGFCNVNELFELPAELARAVEVIRGPANALYGSNAVHGTMNVLLPEPGTDGLRVSGELGPDRYLRSTLLLGRPGAGDGTGVVGGMLWDHDGGFRADSGYRQLKGFVKGATRLDGGLLELGISGNLLDQQTAGFITGQDAYRDEALRLSNSNPESYRNADSQRLALRWQPDGITGTPAWDLRFVLRRSAMDFLQHFLPGQPVEKNGQVSGTLTVLRFAESGGLRLTTGVDAEVARGELEEFQANPETGNPPRPAGRHYDYEAWQYLLSPYLQGELALGDRWTLSGGLRLEYLRYDYDNRMPDGNTRDDGTSCLPVPCLFSRPADRNDDFSTLTPNIGVVVRVTEASAVYATLTRGYRAPQAAELYRLQAGQDVAELDPESIDSLELGYCLERPGLRVATAAFGMRKKDYILQDSNRFNVSNGRSRHLGLEAEAEARTDAGLYAGLAATWARQTYGFSTVITGGETITDGNDIDTAPRTLGSLRLGWDRDPWLVEAEWLHQGRYYLTAQEAQRYPGHDLLNLRAAWQAAPAWTVTVRVNNLTDELYADRADFVSFGGYRYFPGRDREAFVELAYRSP